MSSSHAQHAWQAYPDVSQAQESTCNDGVRDAKLLPGREWENATEAQPNSYHKPTIMLLYRLCVCVAIMVYGPPSVSEKPAWSLAKGCSQTCCRDFAHCVMCTAFFLLSSREEHFTHDYLDTLQKNKALHYKKGSRSFRKNNAKSHVKCEINIKEKKPCTRASCMKIPINCEDFSTAMKSCNQEDCGVLRNDAAQLAAHM